jgi:uncharacterized surface protein with fasciclin (FAS1) repeats
MSTRHTLLLGALTALLACKSEPIKRAPRDTRPPPTPIELRPEPPPAPVIGWDPEDTAGMPAAVVIAHSSSLTAFARLLKAADMHDALWAHGPVTLLIPTDAAFAAVELDRMDHIVDPAQRQALRTFILAHTLPGHIPASSLTSAPHTTYTNLTLVPGRTKRGPTTGGALILRTDIPTLDATIHILDRPLVSPPAP